MGTVLSTISRTNSIFKSLLCLNKFEPENLQPKLNSVLLQEESFIFKPLEFFVPTTNAITVFAY